MKAFLTAYDTTFRKTHDLDELASACERLDASLMDILNPARDLTDQFASPEPIGDY